MKIYPTIAEALTLGTGKLAVDGVVLVGEHGDYPKMRKVRPSIRGTSSSSRSSTCSARAGARCRCSTTSIFRGIGSGRRRCTTLRARWGFRFMAGSSLPVTWRTPSVEMPLGARIREALCVCYGGVDSYDFHGLETIQCMVERRRAARRASSGCRPIAATSSGRPCREGVWPRELMDAALCRSHTLTPARPGFNDIFPSRRRHAAAGEGSGGLSL